MRTKFIFLLFNFFLIISVDAQNENFKITNQNFYSSHNLSLEESYFFPVEFEKTECLTTEDRFNLQLKIAENKNNILIQDPLAFSNLGSMPMFVNPYRPKEGFSDYGYHTLQFQVDQNLTPNGQLLDYFCGQRTYDWSNGNHQGTDFILWPYPWKNMQEGTMEILAAAPGIIVEKRDGYNDLNCNNNGNPNWNGVVIEHAGGIQTIYMHFKRNSLTTKNVGEAVTAGEFLGLAGSSGSSSIPHLHFEVRDADRNVIDPYAGECNSMNSESWWQQQEDYYVPRINRISTHYTTDFDNQCPDVENTYERLNFEHGDLWVLRLFFRDIRNGTSTDVVVKAPDGSTFMSWAWVSNWGSFYPSAQAFWSSPITTDWPEGVYTVHVNFEGNLYETIFGIGTNLGIEEPEIRLKSKIYPNPVQYSFNIESPENIESITVVGVDSRVFLAEKLNLKTAKINIGYLPSGTYFVRVKTASQIETIKILKN